MNRHEHSNQAPLNMRAVFQSDSGISADSWGMPLEERAAGECQACPDLA